MVVPGSLHLIRNLIKKYSFWVRVQFAAWKYWITLRCKVRYGRLFDPHETLWVNTNDVVYACRLMTGESNRWRDRGRVLSGEWDRDIIKFVDMDVYHACVEHFIDEKSWCDTDYYKRLCRSVSAGRKRWGRTREDVDEKMKRLDDLYRSVKDKGYLSRTQLNNNRRQTFESDDEIAIRIGRHGQLLFEDGRHRLAIAKLLGIEKIPVKVTIRHAIWYDYLAGISSHTKSNKGLLNVAGHPDLQKYNL
jgi:hypothetical protein